MSTQKERFIKIGKLLQKTMGNHCLKLLVDIYTVYIYSDYIEVVINKTNNNYNYPKTLSLKPNTFSNLYTKFIKPSVKSFFLYMADHIVNEDDGFDAWYPLSEKPYNIKTLIAELEKIVTHRAVKKLKNL